MGATTPDEPNRLRRLIEQCQRDQNLSLTEIAVRGGLSKQGVAQLMDEDRRPEQPRKATLEGLARGLGVDFDIVLEAAQRDAGMWVERADVGEGDSVLLSAIRDVPPEARDQVLAMVRNIGSAMRAVRSDHRSSGGGNSKGHKNRT
jgi:transcriptional regulator with XRE-family HTH domain